jgi:glycosyltransferase involved in cell wall biosynthesis
MKLVLINNYKIPLLKSMDLYTKSIQKGLKKKIKVEIIYPKPILNKINFKFYIIKKWLGYIDKYLIFGIKIFFTLNKKDIVHICDQANSILFPFIRSKYKIITCHDLIMINYSKQKKNKLSFFGKIYQKLILYYLIKFKNIICVSKHTLKDLSKFKKINNDNIKVIYNSFNKNDFNKNFNKKIIHDKYFLHVGADMFYKNKINLIKIYSEFFKRNKKYKLVLAGDKNSNKILNLIKKLKLQNNIIEIYKPSFYDLKSLYLHAEALIFPSIYEGFGRPIVEAQTLGCPVFTSNLPPMNEVGLDSVFYIDPFNPEKSARIINNKIKNKKKIIFKAYKNIERFDEKIISNQLLNYYKKIYNN